MVKKALMELPGLITSLAMNLGICAILFALYSILRKQPSNKGVYFARCLARMRSKRYGPNDHHWFDKFVPSPKWIVQAWELSEDELMEIGGLDAVVFVKIIVFCLRTFTVAAIICILLVLPMNYFGGDSRHKKFSAKSLEVFTIQNIPEGSKWLWAHCLALYIISCSAWILLYFEYKDVAKMRLAYLRQSYRSPSRFTVLVRGIPKVLEENYSSTLRKFFTRYYPASYMSHQMIYRCGGIVQLMKEAEKMYDMLSIQCQTPLGPVSSTQRSEEEQGESPKLPDAESDDEEEEEDHNFNSQEISVAGKESGAAFVFFRTRYEAATIAQGRQSPNPMLWVTVLAPEPSDVYWTNLCVPYRQFWMRKVGTLMATTAFNVFFLAPVTLVQGLANLQQFERAMPFLKGLLGKPALEELITGYLPSLVLMIFLYMVPPIMMTFSSMEGNISRSQRKKAACRKVLYFNIWNVFFVNLVSGTLVTKLSIFSNPKDIPKQLATQAVPSLIKFFISYVLTSGWTSLGIELVQLFPIVVNFVYKCILRKEKGPYDTGYTFPFHTEVPRVLLFGLLGFAFAVLAPLILPLLVIYFAFGFVIYRNQIRNVYLFEYDTGGKYWPLVHDTMIFSMVVGQVMAMGVFAVKQAPTCTIFATILILLTLLFNEFCRQRFLPAFQDIAAQELIEMDLMDEKGAREEIYKKLETVYSQHDFIDFSSSKPSNSKQSPGLSSRASMQKGAAGHSKTKSSDSPRKLTIKTGKSTEPAKPSRLGRS